MYLFYRGFIYTKSGAVSKTQISLSDFNEGRHVLPPVAEAWLQASGRTCLFIQHI